MQRIVKRIILGAAFVAFTGYLASGIYVVQPHERGVVRWFGRIPPGYREVLPGVHYALPRPFCRVDRPMTTEVRRVVVGLDPARRAAIVGGDFEAMRASPSSDLLTGDVNILKATLVVQYEVTEPAAFLTRTTDVERLVVHAAQSSLLELLAGSGVDQALTDGKTKLQQQAAERAQARLDEYVCGVRIIGATLESIEPPRAIITAFQDVVSAKQDAERVIERAEAESNRILSTARGEASEIHEEAWAYEESRVSRARGESDRFLSIYAEYRKQPELYRYRLYIQTLENILPKIRTYVLDDAPGDAKTHLRLIEPASP